MAAYVELQEAEFAAESRGYTGAKHQREVGTGYFDKINEVIAAGQSSLSALSGSTEEEQFEDAPRQPPAPPDRPTPHRNECRVRLGRTGSGT